MSSSSLEKSGKQFSVVPREFLKEVADFQKKLNSDPAQRDVEDNPVVSGVKFIPIGSIERRLDELFSGLYNIEIKEVKIVGNEIAVHARIHYFHPIAGIWLFRDGIGAAMIRWRKEVPITNMDGKLRNALVADAPHAYAEAIKNAAKKIGVSFGRNLNREDDYKLYQDADEFLSEFDDVEKERILAELAQCQTKDDLSAVWKLNENLQKYIEFKGMIMSRRKELGV